MKNDNPIRNRGFVKGSRSQPKGAKPKTKDRKLKIKVNWQEAIKQKGVKRTGVK